MSYVGSSKLYNFSKQYLFHCSRPSPCVMRPIYCGLLTPYCVIKILASWFRAKTKWLRIRFPESALPYYRLYRRNKRLRNLNWNIAFSITKISFENAVCQMTAFLCSPECVNLLRNYLISTAVPYQYNLAKSTSDNGSARNTFLNIGQVCFPVPITYVIKHAI